MTRMLARETLRPMLAVAGALTALVATPTTVVAQSIMSSLHGESVPIGTAELARSIELFEVSVPPELVWRCHGDYLHRILESEEQARLAVADLGVDGSKFERPEQVRRASAFVRRAAARQDEALEALLQCIAGEVPESERPKLDMLGSELRARFSNSRGLLTGPPHAFGSIYAWDISSFLEGAHIEPSQRDAVRAALLASAPRRERAGRALFESGLANRLRMAELATELGVAGMTMEQAQPRFDEVGRERWSAAAAAGEGAARIERVETELLRLSGCSRSAALEAVLAQRDAMESVARVLSPESAKRLRRVFRNRNLGMDGFTDGQRWASSRPNTPSMMWTAQQVLSRRDLRGERRAKAVRILSEWADAEDAVKDRMASEVLEALARPETVRFQMSPFYPQLPAIPEIVEVAAPFQKRLAALLDMPWIDDPSTEVPSFPEPGDLPNFSREEMLLTGSTRGSVVTAQWTAYEPRARGWLGMRPVDREDLEEWMKLLGLAQSDRGRLEEVAAKHLAEWQTRVAPLLAVAAEPRPRGQMRERDANVYVMEPPEGLGEWRTRIRAALESIDLSIASLDEELLAELRGIAASDDGWCIDAIAFARAADRVTSLNYFMVDFRLWGLDEEVLGGRRVDPVALALRSGLSSERLREAVRAAVPHLAPLKTLADEEHRLLVALKRQESEGKAFETDEEREQDQVRVQNQMLALHARWRSLERPAVGAMLELLDDLERIRMERAARVMRFRNVLSAIDTASRVADELRAAVMMADDVEASLRSIERIDMAEAALAERIERWSASSVAEFEKPPPQRVESFEALSDLRVSRMSRGSGGRRASLFESERFAWFLMQSLPPEQAWRSLGLIRLAASRGIQPPARPSPPMPTPTEPDPSP